MFPSCPITMLYKYIFGLLSIYCQLMQRDPSLACQYWWTIAMVMDIPSQSNFRYCLTSIQIQLEQTKEWTWTILIWFAEWGQPSLRSPLNVATNVCLLGGIDATSRCWQRCISVGRHICLYKCLLFAAFPIILQRRKQEPLISFPCL